MNVTIKGMKFWFIKIQDVVPTNPLGLCGIALLYSSGEVEKFGSTDDSAPHHFMQLDEKELITNVKIELSELSCIHGMTGLTFMTSDRELGPFGGSGGAYLPITQPAHLVGISGEIGECILANFGHISISAIKKIEFLFRCVPDNTQKLPFTTIGDVQNSPVVSLNSESDDSESDYTDSDLCPDYYDFINSSEDYDPAFDLDEYDSSYDYYYD